MRILANQTENHHRASDDARACGEILARAFSLFPDFSLSKFNL